MAKNDKEANYGNAFSGLQQAKTDYNALSDTVNKRGDVTWDRATEDYNPAFQGYSNYASGGGLTPEDTDRMRAAWGKVGDVASSAGGAGGWGGISSGLSGKNSAYQGLSSAYGSAYRPDYTEADTGYRKLTGAGGGFDQSQLDQIYGNVGRLSEIGQTGGITDEDKANINRQSILDQEKTGGYSEQDKALIRAKSAASSPAYFSALKDQLERQRSSTGNLANAGAVDFKLARQGAQQQAQDRTNQEIALGESVRAGRQQAGDFLSNQGMALAGLRTGNELTGARSAGDLGLATQQGITANQATGLRGLGESQTGLGQWGLQQAGGLDQFGLNQAGGLDQFSTNQAQLDMQAQIANAQGAAAGRAGSSAAQIQAARDQAGYEQWVTEYGNQQKQYGIGGLNDLYKTNLGASQGYNNLALNSLNGKYGAEGTMLGYMTANRGNTAMENASTIGGIVGSVGGVLTGLKKKPQTTQGPTGVNPNPPPPPTGPGGGIGGVTTDYTQPNYDYTQGFNY